MKITLIRILSISAFMLLTSHMTFAAESTAKAKSPLSFEQVKTAAQNGDADAQYALGYMYYYGKDGAPKDNAEAKRWIGKAASQKQSQAVKALALINRQQESPTANNSSAETQAATTTAQMRDQNQTSAPARMAANATAEAKESKSEAAVEPKAKKDEQMTLVDARKNTTPKSATAEATHETTADKSDIAQTDAYTLQLLAGSQKEAVAKLIEKHHLGSKAGVYQTTRDNKDWYVLLYGRYKTHADASLAAKKLEQEMAVKPWVKPYASIKLYKKL